MENAKSTRGKIQAIDTRDTEEKFVFAFSTEKIIKLVLCFALHFAKIFSAMHPLGIAFYGAVFTKKNWGIFYVISLAGSIISGSGIIYPIALTAITAILALWDGFKKKVHLRAIACSAVFFVFYAIKCTVEGIIVYDILAAALESFMLGAGVYIFSRGGNILLRIKKRSFVSKSEIMYAYTVMALLIFSLNALPELWGIRISSVVAMTAIFAMCNCGGEMGAIYLAIILGVIGSTQNPAQSALTSTYAFGTLLSSRLKSYGKIGVVLGFVISNTLFSLFLTETHTIVLNLYDSFVAAVIFFLLPEKILEYFGLLSGSGDRKALASMQLSPNSGAIRKLTRMADSFSELSKIYQKLSGTKGKPKGTSLYPIREIKDKVCIGCHRKEKCFSNDGPAIKAMEGIRDPSKLTGASLSKELQAVCHRCDSFAQVLKVNGEKIKSDKQWAHKIQECRVILARQLGGVAASLQNSAKELCSQRDEKAEEKLWSAFDESGLSPSMIYAEEKSDGEFDIEIYFDEKYVQKETKNASLRCVEEALGTGAEFAGTRREKDKIVFVFCPRSGYSATFGYATKAKSGQKVCGDSFNVVYTSRDKMVMLLSDGMGSGENAAKESGRTVSMMEKFLSAGFDCELCAELINSSLILRGDKESFATLDLCAIDLSLSSISFIKLGAAVSYIKSGDKISKVWAKSLPAGILTETEPEKHMLSFESDTVIILMSDGVADIALKHPQREGWIENELKKITPGTNPQIIASRILDTAIKLEEGKTRDDMTVIAACLFKKNSKV